jgi:hypothetical protein
MLQGSRSLFLPLAQLSLHFVLFILGLVGLVGLPGLVSQSPSRPQSISNRLSGCCADAGTHGGRTSRSGIKWFVVGPF